LADDSSVATISYLFGYLATDFAAVIGRGMDVEIPLAGHQVGGHRRRAGWLFQATWVPQHLMAASCVVTAMLLITRYALQPTLFLPLTIALLITAGFESSAFVGGLTFAFAGLIAPPMLFTAADPKMRLRFVSGIAIAALLVVFLIAPFVRDQVAAVHAHSGGTPFSVAPYKVFSEQFPVWLRRLLDVPGYWLIILPVELLLHLSPA
jgi:hypothetical protein